MRSKRKQTNKQNLHIQVLPGTILPKLSGVTAINPIKKCCRVLLTHFYHAIGCLSKEIMLRTTGMLFIHFISLLLIYSILLQSNPASTAHVFLSVEVTGLSLNSLNHCSMTPSSVYLWRKVQSSEGVGWIRKFSRLLNDHCSSGKKQGLIQVGDWSVEEQSF